MADELYKPRFMMGVLERMDKVLTIFLDFFFTEEPPHEQEIIELDKYRSRRSVAPYVNPLDEPTRLKLRPYTTSSLVLPCMAEKVVLNAKDLQQRAAGATIYANPGTYGRRAEIKIGEALKELERRFNTTDEVAAAKGLTTGIIPIKGPNIDAELDLKMPAGNLVTLVGQALWTDYTNSDPLGNLRTWKRVVRDASGRTPRIGLLGYKAADALLKNEGVAKQLDNRRITRGQIDPKDLPDGLEYLGILENIDLYSYDATYVDTAGVEQYFMPPHKILLGSKATRALRHYGPIYNLKSMAVVKRFPNSWVTSDGKARIVQLETSSLPVPHEIESFICAEVTAP